MNLTFLGTSSGSPTKTRNVTSLALGSAANKNWYMIDCGEGTQHQLLHTRLSFKNLKAIVITHIHGDHCYGLPGLLGSAALSGRTETLTIICPQAVADMVKAVQQTTRLWLEFEIEFVITEHIENRVIVDDFEIEPLALSHRVPSWGYAFVERHIERVLDHDKLKQDNIPPGPVWGQIQKGQDVTLDDSRTILADDYLKAPRKPMVVFVGGDNDNPDLMANLSIKPDVVIHEATYTEDIYEKVGKAHTHSCAKIVCEFAQKAGIENLLLTHFSSRYVYNPEASPSIKDIEKEALQYYRGNLFLANDFDVYSLDKKRQLGFSHNIKAQ